MRLAFAFSLLLVTNCGGVKTDDGGDDDDVESTGDDDDVPPDDPTGVWEVTSFRAAKGHTTTTTPTRKGNYTTTNTLATGYLDSGEVLEFGNADYTWMALSDGVVLTDDVGAQWHCEYGAGVLDELGCDVFEVEGNDALKVAVVEMVLRP